MKMLLTPDQESTLWHLTEKVLTPKGEAYYCFPYALRIEPDGIFERIPLNRLPDDVKKHLSTGAALNLEPSEEKDIHDWVMAHEAAEFITPNIYHFKYKGVECTGVVYKGHTGGDLKIRPRYGTDDIGLGAGMAETKYFKR